MNSSQTFLPFRFSSITLTIMLLGLFWGAPATPIHGQAHAGEYMDELTAIFDPVRAETWNYLVTVVQSQSAKKSAKRRADLMRFLDDTKAKVKAHKPWEGDVTIRDSMVHFLELTKQMMGDDFVEIEELEAGSDETFEALDRYLDAHEAANKKYNQAANHIAVAYEQFANRHGITLQDTQKDELGKRIDEAVAAMNYYNQAYRILFKAQIEEARFIRAMEENNITESTLRMKNLAQFSKEGKQACESLGAHKGNKILKIHTTVLMDFFLREAGQQFPVLVEFLKAKEELNTLKAEIDATPADQRTSEQIDRFNQLVEEYNAGVNIYNQTNTDLNAERSKLINDWNARGQEFLQAHIQK